MKAKTIKAVIKKKMVDWVESIEDENVKKLVKKNTIVTGGCIASMLLKEKVNDYDIYFRDKETVKAVTQYYIDRFKIKKKNGIETPIVMVEEEDRISIKIQSSGIASEEGTKQNYEYFESRPEEEAGSYVGEVMQNIGDIEEQYEKSEEESLEVENKEGKDKYRPVFMSTNAITLSGKIQIVIRFYGEPDKIHENYDFVHCTNYWDSGKLVLKQPALEALLARELKYVGSKYPLCSIIRMRKFIKRGWSITAGQILKMAMQLNELDLKNIATLREQLTGVDVAYFQQVLHLLEAKNTEKVDTTYLLEIIDRMF